MLEINSARIKNNFSYDKGFTLIEMLVVIAIIGILASIVLIAINPAQRLAESRDSERRLHIKQLSEALDHYYVMNQGYPGETSCDSSVGSSSGGGCPPSTLRDGWNPSSVFYQSIMNAQVIKNLPVDPINNQEYYYRYEPKTSISGDCGAELCYYWVGVKLEAPKVDGKTAFRCTNHPNATDAPPGCFEVEADLDDFEDDPAPP